MNPNFPKETAAIAMDIVSLAKQVHKIRPGVTPNQITVATTMMVLDAIYMALGEQDRVEFAAGIMGSIPAMIDMNK